jgi:hypothetical protein
MKVKRGRKELARLIDCSKGAALSTRSPFFDSKRSMPVWRGACNTLKQKYFTILQFSPPARYPYSPNETVSRRSQTWLNESPLCLTHQKPMTPVKASSEEVHHQCTKPGCTIYWNSACALFS